MLRFMAPSSSTRRHDDAQVVSGNPKFSCKFNTYPILNHQDYGLVSGNSREETQYVVWGISSLSLCSSQKAEPEALDHSAAGILPSACGAPSLAGAGLYGRASLHGHGVQERLGGHCDEVWGSSKTSSCDNLGESLMAMANLGRASVDCGHGHDVQADVDCGHGHDVQADVDSGHGHDVQADVDSDEYIDLGAASLHGHGGAKDGSGKADTPWTFSSRPKHVCRGRDLDRDQDGSHLHHHGEATVVTRPPCRSSSLTEDVVDEDQPWGMISLGSNTSVTHVHDALPIPPWSSSSTLDVVDEDLPWQSRQDQSLVPDSAPSLRNGHHVMGFSKTTSSWGFRNCTHLVVVNEDTPLDSSQWPLEPAYTTMPAISSSSTLSSLSIENDDLPDTDSFALDIEVESSYHGSLSELATASLPPSSPPRQGLSRFYSGKSRSFSCLGDVVSLKEIVKPENPYARKRKHNIGGSGFDGASGLAPLQKGIGSITKRSLHNSGKSKVALGVALSSMLSNEDGSAQECEALLSPPWGQRKSVASRSFSLSDLQDMCGTHESQCRGS